MLDDDSVVCIRLSDREVLVDEMVPLRNVRRSSFESCSRKNELTRCEGLHK